MRRLVVAISMALLFSGCGQGGDVQKSGNPKAQAIPVEAIKVVTQPQEIIMELPGRSRAYMEAEVRPQVNGILEKRSFTEGSQVSSGQSLYQIDSASYQAALISAQAELERAKAALSSSKASAVRFKELIKTNAVSQQDYDQAQAKYLEAKASVAVAKAAINQAEINLAYTKVAAPISGRIGKSSVTPGALVTAGQAQALAKISQLDPIYIDIEQSSSDMLRLKQRIAQGNLMQPKNSKVELILEDGSVYSHSGELQFAEVTVNENTGAVSLRAEFPNPDGILLPGMFVRTKIRVGEVPNAILIPQKAISRDPKGQGLAMVINAEGKAEPRAVNTAEAINHQWLVTEGLNVGDQVIVDGLQKIRPGSSVTAKTISAPQTTQ